MTEAMTPKQVVARVQEIIAKRLVIPKPRRKPDLLMQAVAAGVDVELAEIADAMFVGTDLDNPIRRKERMDRLIDRRDGLVKEYLDSQDQQAQTGD